MFRTSGGAMTPPKHRHAPDLRNAANRDAWALGQQQRNGFHVRRIVWGLLLARTERREGEEVRKARILIGARRR